MRKTASIKRTALEKVLCYLAPESTARVAGDLAPQLRDRLDEALERGLSPAALPISATRRAIDLTPEQARRVRALARTHDLAPGRVVGGLLLALHDSEAALSRSRIVRPVVDGLRAEQAEVVTDSAEHLREGKWVLLEAGTGAGKSRIAAHLADFVLRSRDGKHLHWPESSEVAQLSQRVADTRERARAKAAQRKHLDPDPRAVIVCAPTLENVLHLRREFLKVAETLDPRGLYTHAVVLGRGQFVSLTAVAELHNAQETPDPAVAQWLNRGMPPKTDAARELAQLMPAICGLTDDLRAVASENFPIDDARLTEDSPAEEAELYEALRASAQHADVVFATHAMLAIDNLRLMREEPPVLPGALALIVDEAHNLESAQAEAARVGLALSRVQAVLRNAPWTEARARGDAEHALLRAQELDAALRALPQDVPLPSNRIGDSTARRAWERCLIPVARLSEALAQLLKRRERFPASLNAALKLLLAAQSALSGIEKGYNGAVTLSPVRRNPHVVIGPSSVDRVLAARWETTFCGVLMSGTLLYPSVQGPLAQPVINRLMLPPERTAAVPIIRPHWLRSIPTVYVPPRNAAEAFVPPSGDLLTSDTLRAWLAVVSIVIVKHQAPTAAGGTLVLLTGYERLTLLAELLAPLSDRLLVQDPVRLPLLQARTQFLLRGRAGERPIWLATGGAGVGLNLSDEMVSDEDAHRDLLLTDLIIPSLPFGANRSSTQLARAEWAGFIAEKQEALRTFQQWIGRLVRRDGVRSRRLWVLDGRLFTRGWSAEFLRIVLDYPSRREIAIQSD